MVTITPKTNALWQKSENVQKTDSQNQYIQDIYKLTHTHKTHTCTHINRTRKHKMTHTRTDTHTHIHTLTPTKIHTHTQNPRTHAPNNHAHTCLQNTTVEPTPSLQSKDWYPTHPKEVAVVMKNDYCHEKLRSDCVVFVCWLENRVNDIV